MMKFTRLAAVLALALPLLAEAAPQYTITDLGTVGGNLYSQTFGLSNNGSYVVGRTIQTGNGNWPAFTWNASTGMQAQAQLPGRNYAWGYGINDSGNAVGVAALSETGGSPLPVLWSGGVATQLTLPAGQTAGRAFDINNAGMAVGSVGSGTGERAVMYNTVSGKTTMISAFSTEGSYMQTALGISDNGIVVGNGVDFNGRTVMLSYNTATSTMTQLAMPAYGGFNSSVVSGISPNGSFIVGTSGNSSQAILWSQATGAVIATLPSISSSGSLTAVNDLGWAVGSSGGQYSNPFLYAQGSTYLISDIIVNGAGWNFSTTTSASAQGIGNNGVIVGTAQINGIEHAYMLTPVPEPTTYALMLGGLLAVGFAARRKAGKQA